MTSKTTFSVSFYPRSDKTDKNKTVPIYMRVTVNGRRAEIATNRRFDIKRWKNGRALGRTTDAIELQIDLNNMKAGICKIWRDMSERHEEITAQRIKGKFTGNDERPEKREYFVQSCDEMNFGED